MEAYQDKQMSEKNLFLNIAPFDHFSGLRGARTRGRSNIWEKFLFWHLFILVSLHGIHLAFFEIPKKFFSELVSYEYTADHF